MSIALYRKYRPKTFAEVTNQNHIKVTLQSEIESGKLSHAYLFCGPRGTGKTTLARLLSKAANCLDLQKNGEPCNQCESCQEIINNKSLDIIEIDAASHTGVDNVRENIINNARFTPAKSKFKVFIIDEVHMLSISAFNALLKILEEPPKHVIFILATTEAHKVPVTIISRCQRFDFKKIIPTELVSRLQWIVSQEGIQVDDEVLKIIAKHSGGCVRDAESLLEQILSLGDKNISFDQAQLVLPRSNFDSCFDLFSSLVKKDAASAISLINDLVEQGIDIFQFVNSFIEFLRSILIYRLNNDINELNSEVEDQLLNKIIDLAQSVQVIDLVQMISVLLNSKDNFSQSYILQLPLEIAIVQITQGQSAKIVDQDINLPSSAAEKKIVKNDNPYFADLAKAKKKNNFNQASRKKSISVAEQKNCSALVNKQSKINQQADNVLDGSNFTLTFNQVFCRWPLILQQVKNKDYTLGMSLSVAKPLNLANQTLKIGFLFDLQKQRVDKPQSLAIIEEILYNEFKQKIQLELLVDTKLKLSDITNGDSVKKDEDVKIEQDQTTDPVKAVLDVFGGSVVDKI